MTEEAAERRRSLIRQSPRAVGGDRILGTGGRLAYRTRTPPPVSREGGGRGAGGPPDAGELAMGVAARGGGP